MTSPAHDELRESLRAWAVELSAKTTTPPVLVRDVCKELGVKVTKSERVPLNKAYLSIDPTKSSRAEILLPKKVIGSFERFCVAHELGHYLVYLAFGMVPKGESEYWKHEQLCDEFARNLLLPTPFIAGKVAGPSGQGAEHYLRLCESVARQAWMPWTQTALRLTEFRDDITYLKCRQFPLRELKFVTTTHPHQKGRGKIVDRGSKLWALLTSLIERANKSIGSVRSDLTNLFLEREMYRTLGLPEHLVVVGEARMGLYANAEVKIVAESRS